MKSLIVFTVILSVALADLAKFESCGEDSVCEIHEVRITPCKKKNSCVLKKGNKASISFDFTPKFSSDAIKTGLFWESSAGDVPFPELQAADGCALTACPLADGSQQELNYNLQLSKKLPTGKYTFKWKIWTGESDIKCCFRTNVELRK